MIRQPIKAAAIAALFLISTPIFTADLAPELNRAQQLIFIQDHLQGTAKGSSLNYAFSSETKGGENYTDKITITVTDVVGEDKRNLEFDFLSGSNHIDFSPAMGYTGNPVIIHFLERDISRMTADTGGSSGYFRSRIRKSFGQPTDVRDIKISFDEKELDGVMVIVEPFTSDPNIANFEIYANKRYEFTFSDQVPGGVYRIHSLVPGKNEAGVLIDEELTFHRLTPAI